MFFKHFRIFITLLLVLCVSNVCVALNIAIIESQSTLSGHTMDVAWQNIATGMGHTATIRQQTFLDNSSFFSSTDILIVSSGVISIPSNRVTIILQYIQQGGEVYIQGEYQGSYDANQAFQTIVNTLGGNFSWTATANGDLNPMNVMGTLAQTNVAVSPLSYYWYGCYGWGCDVQAFLEYQGNYFGFYYSSANPAYGKIITTTDQDWVKDGTSPALMQNIITHLSNPSLLTTTTNSGSVNLGPDTTLCSSTLQLDAGLQNASYLWSTGATSKIITAAVPGTYSVTATLGSCTYTDAIQLTSGSALQISLGQDESACNGETILVDAGNAGDSFSWSSGETTQSIFINQSGTYLVTVTDNNGCSGTASKTITFNSLPVANITTSGSTSICSGTAVSLLATGGMSYSWNTGSTFDSISVSQSGSYTVTATDGNACSDTASVAIATGNNPPVAQFTYSVNDTSAGFKNQSQGATNYLWTFGDGNTTTVSDPNHPYANAGAYEVCLFASNFCGADTMCVTIQYGSTGIEEVNHSFVVSPNPFTNVVTLKWINESDIPKRIEFFTIAGQKIFNKDVLATRKSEVNISLPEWMPNGMYFMKIYTEQKIVGVKLTKVSH